mgnify:FL=1
MLPSFSELTYHAFELPKSSELDDLYKSVKEIARKYYGKEAIRIFPYVSPELYANNQKNYMSELDLENSIGIRGDNLPDVAEKMFKKLEDSYIPNPCQDYSCEWYDDCRLIKWLWAYTYDNAKISTEQKLKSFCNLKKALNNGLFDGIMEQGNNVTTY